MDKFKTIGVGGLPHTLNDFRQFLGRLATPTEGIYQAFNNIVRGFGDSFIVQGCVVSGSTGAFSITEGWILLDGELIKVEAQGPFDESTDSNFTKVTTFDSRGTKTFLNGSIEETYEKNRGVISGTSGTLAFNGDALGVWQEEDFDASDYSSVTGTWTLTDPATEIRTFILGKMMTVNITIAASTIASGPTSGVIIKVPRGKTISKGMTSLGRAVFGGSAAVIFLQTQIVGNTISITALDGATFPNGNLVITAQITFEID